MLATQVELPGQPARVFFFSPGPVYTVSGPAMTWVDAAVSKGYHSCVLNGEREETKCQTPVAAAYLHKTKELGT